jgi:hypothetical protein
VAYQATPGGPDGRTLVELWRDTGTDVLFAKFCPPTVADGKVFRATFAPNTADPNNPQYMGPASIVVYGLKG